MDGWKEEGGNEAMHNDEGAQRTDRGRHLARVVVHSEHVRDLRLRHLLRVACVAQTTHVETRQHLLRQSE